MNRFLVKSVKNQFMYIFLREMNYSSLEMYNIKKFKKEFLPNKKNMIGVISKLCNIPKKSSLLAIVDCPDLSKVSQISIENNFQICRQYFSEEFIKENLSILSYKNLKEKFEKLQSANLDLNIYYPFLNMNDRAFKSTINSIISNKNLHLNVLCDILQVSEREVVSEIAKRPFIFKYPITRVSEALTLFKEFGLDSHDILSDIWIIRHSLDKSRTRLKILQELGLKKIKPWMVRCSEKLFEEFVSREKDFKKAIRNELSVEEYLAKRLNCSKESANEFKKLLRISKVSQKKVDELLDYFFEQGFTETEILCTPRIFQHDINKIKHRVNELQNLGYKPSSLLIFCSTKEKYDLLINNLKYKLNVSQ